MGASNVAKCYTRWQHLPDRAFRALVYMALVSLDADEAPRYFGGREALVVHGLGRPLVPEPAPSDSSARAEEFRKLRRADFQAAKVVISQLVKAGCIRCSVAPARGRQAEYELTLDASTGASTGYVSPTQRGTSDVPTGYVERTDRGTSDVPPRSSEEPGGTRGGTTSPQVTTSPAAVDNPDYANASNFLRSLHPDTAQRYIEKVEHLDGYVARVIAAAELAKAETPTASLRIVTSSAVPA